MVMHYHEQKKLDIHGTVVTYIDRSEIGHIDGIETVTVLELLKHESGISDYANNPVWRQRIAANKAPAVFDEKIKLVVPERKSPGQFSYSNTNYLLLEKVIENVTTLSYVDAFNTYFKNIGFTIIMGSQAKNLQAFFAATKEKSSNVSALEEHYGFDGGAYTTPQELLNFFSALFGDQSILSQDSIALMQSWIPMVPQIPVGSAKIRLYGTGLMHLQTKNTSYVGHMGGTLKYQSFAFFNPKKDTIVVAMTNSSGRHYNNAFFQELIPSILDVL